MAKFKVGDKVKIKEDLRKTSDSSVYGVNVVSDMAEKKGTIVTIKHIGICKTSQRYLIEEDIYTWTEEMFEGLANKIKATEIKLKGKEMFEIKSYKVINNKVVEVEFADGDKQKSVCMDGDTFDEERGLEVCIMKHLLGKSKYHKVLKEANKQIVALDEKAKADKAEADKEANKKAKAAKNKAERKAKRRAENIADMTEAFTAALKANGIDASVKDVSESTLDKILSVFKK